MVFGVLFLRLLLCQGVTQCCFHFAGYSGRGDENRRTDRQRKGDLHKSSKRTRVIWQTRLATRPRGLTAKENDVFEVTLASPATTRVSPLPPPLFSFCLPSFAAVGTAVCRCCCCKFSFSFQLFFVGGERAIHVPFLDSRPCLSYLGAPNGL